LAGKTSHFCFLPFSPHLERPGDEQVYIPNKELVKKPMGTKSFVQIEISAVFTSTSSKKQFRSGVFDHFKILGEQYFYVCRLLSAKGIWENNEEFPTEKFQTK
jgi:hypothetical protein